MHQKHLIALFICSLTTWLVGVSIMPLLPLYAVELGASSAATGAYLAFSFAMLAAGTMLAGRLRRRRDVIVLAGAVALPATWLMGHVTAVWQLTLLTSIIWFAAGVAITQQSILMGLYAAAEKRGRMFGLLASTISLAGLIGGLSVGPLADRWGYSGMFAALAMVWLVQITSGLLLPRKTAVPAASPSPTPTLPLPELPKSRWTRPFQQLLLANLLVSVAESVGMIGGSLAMHTHGVTLTVITLLAAFQAGAGLLIHPGVGRLSDVLARKTVLMLTYVARILGLVALAWATSLPGFWLMAACFTLAAAKNAVNPALVTDVAGNGRLDSYMSILTASNWIGHVIGFALAGYALQHLGLTVTFLLSALLPLLAILALSANDGAAAERPWRPRRGLRGHRPAP